MKHILKSAIVLCFAVFGCFFFSTASYAAVSLQGWDLVDSGKHCDWDGTSAYLTPITNGASTWNAYKSGVIRKDTIFTLQDVAISDYYEVSTTCGETGSSGYIYFNTYQMQNFSADQRKSVAMHELGHCLGLGHNTSTSDVMYTPTQGVTTLSQNDKDSYDAAYNNY
ncbi:MAG: matrixin family metalloprotease [Desulfitobacteriaceae bacterium]